MADYQAFNEAVTKAGVFKGASRLQDSSTAATVRVTRRRTRVLRRPSSRSKMHLGGFYIIDVPDLDAAVAWAARCPAARHGAIEVRPGLSPW